MIAYTLIKLYGQKRPELQTTKCNLDCRAALYTLHNLLTILEQRRGFGTLKMIGVFFFLHALKAEFLYYIFQTE